MPHTSGLKLRLNKMKDRLLTCSLLEMTKVLLIPLTKCSHSQSAALKNFRMKMNLKAVKAARAAKAVKVAKAAKAVKAARAAKAVKAARAA